MAWRSDLQSSFSWWVASGSRHPKASLVPSARKGQKATPALPGREALQVLQDLKVLWECKVRRARPGLKTQAPGYGSCDPTAAPLAAASPAVTASFF